MSTSVLDTSSFWRQLLERAGRQAAQTALPIVAAVGAAGVINVTAVVVAVVVAVLVTVLKALAGVAATPDEPLLWQLLDRAVPAAAGTLLGFVPVDLANIEGVDWSAVGFAAVSAAVVAMLAYYVTPPSNAVRAQVQAEESSSNETAPLASDEVL